MSDRIKYIDKWSTCHGNPASKISIIPGAGGGGNLLPSCMLNGASIVCPLCRFTAYFRTMLTHWLYTIVFGEFLLLTQMSINVKERRSGLLKSLGRAGRYFNRVSY